MSFFRPLGSSKVSYDDYISSVLAGDVSQKYLGVSALKNSDILTATSIIAGDIARFPLVKKDVNGDIIHDEDINRRLYRIEFDTRSVTGRNVDEIVKLVNNQILTPNQGLIELGKQKSTDPNMDRYQSSLNYVFLDKKEEYQDKVGIKGKGGEVNAKEDKS